MLLSLSAAGALSIVISILIARELGASDFGLYSVLISVQGVVLLVASFSEGTAIAKYVAEYRSRDEEQALSFAKSGLVLVAILACSVCVVYVMLGPTIGNRLYDESAMVKLVPFSALVVFSSSIFSASVGMVQGCQRLLMLAGMQIASPLLALGLIVVLLQVMGVEGIFIGYFVSQLVVASVAFATLNKSGFRFVSARLELGRKSPALSKMYSFALPAVLGGVMVIPVIWIANTELILSSGFMAMGYFAVAFVIYQALTVIPSAISVPMMPRISQLAVVSHEDVEDLVRRTMRTLSIGLFPVLFGVALFSEAIVETLFGSGFRAATDTLYLMVSATYFYSLASIVGILITGTGRMWLGLGLNVSWAAMFLGLVFLGVPALGTTGLGVSYLISYGIFLILAIISSERLLNVKVKGMRLSGLSAAILFSAGFFLFGEGVLSGSLGRVALLAISFAYYYLIGPDVFEMIYLRAKEAVLPFIHRVRL